MTGGLSQEDTKTDFSEIYMTMSEVLPVREDATIKPEKKTLAEALSEPDSDSDKQTALNRLFPQILKDAQLNQVQVGRIFPDVFLPMLKLLVMRDIEQTPPNIPIDVPGSLVRNYIALSIGSEGKGRVDTIEVLGAGATNEDILAEKAKDSMNLP